MNLWQTTRLCGCVLTVVAVYGGFVCRQLNDDVWYWRIIQRCLSGKPGAGNQIWMPVHCVVSLDQMRWITCKLTVFACVALMCCNDSSSAKAKIHYTTFPVTLCNKLAWEKSVVCVVSCRFPNSIATNCCGLFGEPTSPQLPRLRVRTRPI